MQLPEGDRDSIPPLASSPTAAGLRAPSLRLLAVALAGLAILMGVASSDFGVTWDEPVHQQYGGLVNDYFASGLEDLSVLELSNLYLYGGLFDLLCVLAHKAVPAADPYDLRHLLNAAFGWLGVFFACRLALLLASTRTALLTLGTLALWPVYFGHSMNNPKDIPFAAFYTAGVYYLCRLARESPRLRLATVAGAGTAAALAINVRAGGILLLAYFGLLVAADLLRRLGARPADSAAPHVRRVLAILVLVPLAALLLGTAFWPWAQRQPFTRPFEALAQMNHFEWKGKVLFDGVMLRPSDLPWDYAPRWFLLTTPLLVLAGLALSLVRLGRRGERQGTLLLLLAATIPVAFVIWQRSALYDGIRHLLFIVPVLAVAAAIGIDDVLPGGAGPAAPRSAWTWAAAALLALLALEPLAFSLRNHPHQYTYFNPLAGGPSGAFGRYELDYWGNCYKPALRWLAAHGADRTASLEFGAIGGDHLPRHEIPKGANLTFLGASWEGHIVLRLLRGRPKMLRRSVSEDDVLERFEADGAPLCLAMKGARWDAMPPKRGAGGTTSP